MLTQVAASNGKKPIFINAGNLAASAVVYTVPTGKTFTGHLWARGAESINVTINGVQTQISHSPQTAPSLIPLSLASGGVVQNPSSGYQYVLTGVEE